METQNEKSRDMLEQARLENQSLLSRARCAQIESQRLIVCVDAPIPVSRSYSSVVHEAHRACDLHFYAQRLQMASDRANEELKRRLACEKRNVR